MVGGMNQVVPYSKQESNSHDCYFLHDGATAHYSGAIRESLNET